MKINKLAPHPSLRIVISIFLLLSSTFGQENDSRWILIGESNDGSIIYHDSTYKRLTNGNILIWEKYVEPTGDHSLVQSEFDCVRRRSLLVRVAYYEKNGTIKDSNTIAERNREWEEPIPESIGEMSLETICQYSNSRKTSASRSQPLQQSPKKLPLEPKPRIDFSDVAKPRSGVTSPESQRNSNTSFRAKFPQEDPGVDLGVVIVNKANLRDGPSTTSAVLMQLAQGSFVALVERIPVDDWYRVIDIESSSEGWLHASTIETKLTNRRLDGPALIERDSESNGNPYVVINNEANVTLYLSVGNKRHTISPKATETIYLTPGPYKYYASSPGVIPKFGERVFSAGKWYTWRFYIVTRRR